MELRHLRYFVAVVEEGSFTTAAEGRLHTSQPSLSRQIRDLEYEVGAELLSRSVHGVELTAVRVAHNVRLAVGDTAVSLPTLDVLVNSIARDESSNYLDCNLGHDVFDQFGETIVNFRDMAFLLR